MGSLILLLATTIFVITSVVDPNRYRGKVESIVGDLAGRPLTIEGNLELTWFPWLGVRMGRAYLSDRSGATGPSTHTGNGTIPPVLPIIEWESMSVAAKVLPLLKGQVVVDRVRLQSPHLRLRRDAQGHGNWEGLGPQGRAPKGPGPESSAAPSQQKAPPQIAGLEVRDGMLEYVDEASGLKVNLSSLDFDVGEWRAGQSLPVHARFLAHGGFIPPGGIWVELDTPELVVQQEPLRVSAPKMAIKVADARIDGGLAYEQTADGHVSARGSIAAHAPSVRKLATELALNQTLPHDPTTLGPLELTTDWSYADGLLGAKPILIKLDGVTFRGWVERGAPPQPAWRFELHGDRIDLDRYVNVDSTSQKPFELPVDTLRAINANGSLIFDKAEIADATLSDVRLRFQTAEAKQ